MAKSVIRWCQEWLVELPGWATYAPKGHGVTANLVAKRMLLPWLKAQKPPCESLIRPDAQGLMAALDRHRGDVLTLLSLLRCGVDQVFAVAKERGLDTTVGRTAEKLAGALGSNWAQGVVLTDMELESVGDTFLRNSVSRDKRMERREFEGYAGLFDRVWADQGARNLAIEPYSRYGLGDDEPPPLIRPGRENMYLGLQRSVFSRYSMAARNTGVGGDADAIAQREIVRACSLLGLAYESSRVLLRSLNAGFLFGPSEPAWTAPARTPSKRGWADSHDVLQERDSPIDDERLPRGRGVHTELAAMAQAMLATFTTSTAQGHRLRLSARMNEAHEDAMRRGWHDTFRADMTEAHVTEATAARIVATAIYHGIASGQKIRMAAREIAGHSPQETHDEASLTRSEGQRMDPAAFNRAWNWLAANQQRAEALLIHNDEDAIKEYERAADELGLPRLDALSQTMEMNGT